MSGRGAARFGLPHAHYAVCASTNDVAKTLAEQGAPHGACVTAGEQSAGRGRQGRAWVAPPGSALLLSVIARPVTAAHKLAPLAAAVAVAETCERLAGAEARIKWPNDVWIDGRKVAGILVEARPDRSPDRSWLVVGVGLNTAVRLAEMPPDLQETATTLALPRDVDALTPMLASLEHWLDAGPHEVAAAWRARDALIDRRIAWSGGEGVATGIDEQGNLIVETAGGELHALTAGEVHLAVRD